MTNETKREGSKLLVKTQQANVYRLVIEEEVSVTNAAKILDISTGTVSTALRQSTQLHGHDSTPYWILRQRDSPHASADLRHLLPKGVDRFIAGYEAREWVYPVSDLRLRYGQNPVIIYSALLRGLSLSDISEKSQLGIDRVREIIGYIKTYFLVHTNFNSQMARQLAITETSLAANTHPSKWVETLRATFSPIEQKIADVIYSWHIGNIFRTTRVLSYHQIANVLASEGYAARSGEPISWMVVRSKMPDIKTKLGYPDSTKIHEFHRVKGALSPYEMNVFLFIKIQTDPKIILQTFGISEDTLLKTVASIVKKFGIDNKSSGSRNILLLNSLPIADYMNLISPSDIRKPPTLSSLTGWF